MKKRFYSIDEGMKKELLSRLFGKNYASTDTDRLQELYCGYFGITPLQVKFLSFAAYVDRLGKVTPSTSASINNEILCQLLNKEEFDSKSTDVSDFNDKLFVNIDSDNRGVALFFHYKEN